MREGPIRGCHGMVQNFYAGLVARAQARLLDLVELLNGAESLRASGFKQMGADLYQVWVEHNPDHPGCYAICFNLGIALSDVNDLNGAIAAYRKSLELNKDFLSVHVNLGGVLERNGHPDQAVAEWNLLVNTLEQVNDTNRNFKANALKQISRVYEAASQYNTAEGVLKTSIDLDPTQRDVIQHWVSCRQLQCKWPAIEPVHTLAPKDVKKVMSPLSLSIYADDPLLQMAAAYYYSKDDVGMPAPYFTAGNWVPPVEPTRRPLRIGYLSSDLRGHAVGYLTAEIYELHDRRKVEVFVYYCGVRFEDEVKDRIRKTADHWQDINDLNDHQAAAQIINDKIDILIDLNGHTKDARTKMLALKPAPIIVNWLGYPGTMGSAYHQYIIADDFIIPKGAEHYYTEKVVRLPCYQPNDRRRTVSPLPVSRAEAGLPDDAVVFCCFNGPQKITRENFGRWMDILQNVPKGVLWLLGGKDEARAALRRELDARGIAQDRLVYAETKLNAEHVARYRLADLFLDTSPYGAHTTASDALWMGVPILTMVGRGFASRVCGSLAKSAGLSDLVTTSPAEYVSKAIQLGNSPALLAEYKRRLAEALPTCALFDTASAVWHLEQLYEEMWRDFCGGFIHRPDMTNLDVYLEIGILGDHEEVEYLTKADYEQFYRRGLAYRHSFAPLKPDLRLWDGTYESVIVEPKSP